MARAVVERPFSSEVWAAEIQSGLNALAMAMAVVGRTVSSVALARPSEVLAEIRSGLSAMAMARAVVGSPFSSEVLAAEIGSGLSALAMAVAVVERAVSAVALALRIADAVSRSRCMAAVGRRRLGMSTPSSRECRPCSPFDSLLQRPLVRNRSRTL